MGEVSIRSSRQRINTPGGEDVLVDGCADMVSMARPFLAGPHFVAKARSGRSRADHAPLRTCNQACLDHTFDESRPVW
jgi:2,4-dienoyl-CoA reductase (NADPH2)